MIKILYTFFFLLFIFCTNAQKIEDRDYFRKCRKEFSKKICITDEDKDGVLFYKDNCPKIAGVTENSGCPWSDADRDGIFDKDDMCPDIAGSQENNGCPWTDTDGDGILDKDDACPTVPGVIENNGCPSQKLDCTKFYKDEKLKFDKFRNDNNEINKIYNLLSINILNYFKIKNKNVVIKEVYLDFLDYGPQCLYYPRGYIPQCESGRRTDEYNFLITKFWNKNALENFSKKKNVSIQMKYYFKNYEKEFGNIISEELHDFLVSKKVNDGNVVISQKSLRDNQKEISLKIKIKFIHPYQLEIEYTPFAGGVYPVSSEVEYKNGNWIEVKKQN